MGPLLANPKLENLDFNGNYERILLFDAEVKLHCMMFSWNHHLNVQKPSNTIYLAKRSDLFLFCYERDFMLSLSDDNESEVTEAFNSTSRYLDDLLNIVNNFFDSMVNHIYPSQLQLIKANVSDTEASFLDLHLSMSNGLLRLKFLINGINGIPL